MLDLDLGEEGSGRRRHGLGEGEMRGGYGEMRKGRKGEYMRKEEEDEKENRDEDMGR